MTSLAGNVSEFLRKRVLTLGGLGTVPGFIALGIWFLSIPSMAIDAYYPGLAGSIGWTAINYDTASDLVSLIGTASITTLGLVYSIVLVVFATAASNIGPRLLQRFTGDRINQITAGLFGGTYLGCLGALH